MHPAFHFTFSHDYIIKSSEFEYFSTSATCTTSITWRGARCMWGIPRSQTTGSETSNTMGLEMVEACRTPMSSFHVLEKALRLLPMFVESHLASQYGSNWKLYQCHLLLAIHPISEPCKVIQRLGVCVKCWEMLRERMLRGCKPKHKPGRLQF